MPYISRNVDYEEKLYNYLLAKNGKATKRELFLEVFDRNMGLMLYYLSENLLSLTISKNTVRFNGKEKPAFLRKRVFTKKNKKCTKKTKSKK